MTETLHFGFTPDPPPLESVVVYERLETDHLGVPFVFDVIGTSHHVYAPSLSFHEVASCERLPGGTVENYPLRPGLSDRLTFESEAVVCETAVWTEAGAVLPEDPDVAYAFSERADTAIVLVEGGYDTYHTYPEHGLTVRSESRLQRR